MIRTKILLAATAACAIAVSADVIEFKSGSKLTGKVVRIQGGEIMFDADDVGSVKIAQDKVARMTTDKANTVQYKDMSTEEAVVNMSNGVYTASGRTLDMGNVKAVNPEAQDWHGSANLSATAARGNTVSEKVTFLADIAKRWESDRLTGDFGYYFAQSGTSHDDKEKTENRVALGAQYDHFWVTKVYSYLNGKYERDGINDLQYRYRLGTGLGYQWLENEVFESTGKWSFNQEVGITYIKEKYEHQKDDDRATFRYAHHAAWNPRWLDKLAFTHNFEYLPDFDDWADNYLIDTDVGFSYELAAAWQLMGKWEWEYNSNPGGGTKSSDFRYTLGLGYKW